MLRKILVFSIALLALSSFAVAGSGPDVKEGMWEITSQMKMPGMSMPPMTFSHCITKQDLVPQNNQPGAQCKVTNMKTKGNTVSWTTVCDTGNGKATSTGWITYKGTSFEGEVKMNQGGMVMTSTMKGKRVGPCK